MGNTVSCCVSPEESPKLPRQPVDRHEDYQIITDVSDDTGPYLQHISDREVPDELAQESNPSDHARASTIFLCKSQTDSELRDKRKSNHINHVSHVSISIRSLNFVLTNNK
ncbi:unnamed protein product [Oncorhynchus mykiss]|uniref:Uncharacterized protein n=1 Tax=Oncorhynchus mykiss TaxID=8022 RepID=A0A060YBP2_ONCMY|nr:unnamed protein product [Oncorhynchus mykiss]